MDDAQLTQLLKAYGSLTAIIAIGLVVILFCLAALIAYRRHIYRQQKLTQRFAETATSKEKPDDLWRTGGERLTQSMDPPFSEKDLPFEEENDDEEDEDEEDDDDDDRWWKRSDS